jgi:hypothetical protein
LGFPTVLIYSTVFNHFLLDEIEKASLKILFQVGESIRPPSDSLLADNNSDKAYQQAADKQL